MLAHASGRDRLYAGAGDDRLFARDRGVDWLNGGAGRDRAAVDRRLDPLHAVEVADRF